MRPDTANGDGVVDSLAAPDLDGDGTRDVITVSRFEGGSGASGSGGAASERSADLRGRALGKRRPGSVVVERRCAGDPRQAVLGGTPGGGATGPTAGRSWRCH